jgi:hypothetical protein
MSRFVIGLLLGLLAGIAGTSAFLIVYGGGDYLVSTSPRVRELEASLRNVDEDRDWLKTRLRESTESTQRLESRFEALAARFESITSEAASLPAPTAAPMAGADVSAAGDDPSSADTALPAPTAAPERDRGSVTADPYPVDPSEAAVGDDPGLPSPSPTP